ncbi:MAG: hypothetical protein AAF497_03450 [Planctomycetota bacterium]
MNHSDAHIDDDLNVDFDDQEGYESYEDDYHGESDWAEDESEGSALVPILVASSVGIMSVVQALDARLASFEKIAYAGLFGILLLVALLSRFRFRDFGWATLIGAVCLLPAISIAYQPHVYPLWIMGDMIILLAPIVFWLIMQSHPRVLESRYINVMLALFLLGALIAPAFANATEHGRFEPPRFLLFAAGWYVIFRGQKIANTLTVALITFLLLGVTWFSDVRVAVLLWFAAGGLTAVMVSSLQRFLVLGALGFAMLVGMMFVVPSDSDLFRKSRFAKVDIRAITENDFVKYRLGECKEVLQFFRRTANVPHVIFGHGFGAAYPSNGTHLAHAKSSAFRKAAMAQKLNEHGFAHTLHFGPMRVYFRYGLIGIAAYLVLGYFVTTDIFRVLMGRTHFSDREDIVYTNTIILVTLFCMLARFHLKNVEHDLDFAFVVAAYLTRRHWFQSISDDVEYEDEYEDDVEYEDEAYYDDEYAPEYA